MQKCNAKKIKKNKKIRLWQEKLGGKIRAVTYILNYISSGFFYK